MGQIIVTGAEGFIGSNLIDFLNNNGIYNIILVDSVNNSYLNKAHYNKKMTIEEFTLFCITAIYDHTLLKSSEIDVIFHLGAMVDTASRDRRIIDYNLTFSRILFDLCALKNIPLLYSSSAAIYGRGRSFSEDENNNHPLNLYAESKYLFDKYVLSAQKGRPEYWYGFRLFNVYGPNEFHKGKMASAITQIYLKALQNDDIALFKSLEPEIQDGFQMRDFIHVGDVINAMYYFYTNRVKIPSGIYNLGTGKAISFLTIADLINDALGLNLKIRFIDTPEAITHSYQSFTQADLTKILKYIPYISHDKPENSIRDYYKYLGHTIKSKPEELNSIWQEDEKSLGQRNI